ncbi:MAG: hypothetical protein R2875_03635 [Desulfobacterales bacterium]
MLRKERAKNHLKKPMTASPVELTGRTSENRIVNFDGLPEFGIDIDRVKRTNCDVEITKAYSNSLCVRPVQHQAN